MYRPTKKPVVHDSVFRDSLIWHIVLYLLVVAILALYFMLNVSVSKRSQLAQQSTSDHGHTIFEFIENTRYLDYEVYGEFDFLGIKLYEATQQDDAQVAYDPTVMSASHTAAFGKHISIHNHPLQDCPFSDADLLSFSFQLSAIDPDCSSVRQLVISPHYVYELSAPNGWPSYADTALYFRSLETTAEIALRDGLIAPSAPNGVVEPGAYVTTDRLLEQYATHFGLIYTVTPIESWNLF